MAQELSNSGQLTWPLSVLAAMTLKEGMVIIRRGVKKIQHSVNDSKLSSVAHSPSSTVEQLSSPYINYLHSVNF